MEESFDRAAQAIAAADMLVVLTGAGMSADSNLATFAGESSFGVFWGKSESQSDSLLRVCATNADRPLFRSFCLFQFSRLF